jgi:parallel beta-helix repeat protein
VRYAYRLTVLGALLTSVSTVSAATVHVAQTAPGPAHDGASWQTAFTTVEAGLAAANAGDEVWVRAGSYVTEAEVPAGVSLYGNFVGTETDRDQRLGMPRFTILVKNYTRPILSFGAGVGSETVVNGFVFLGAGRGYNEGVIRCVDASPTISNNIFRRARKLAATDGPGVFISSQRGAPAIENNILTESPAEAIYCDSAGGRIVNNTIAGNGGAGIYSTGSTTPFLANNILAFNVWGVYIYRAPAAVMRNNCVFGNPGGDYAGMPDHGGEDGNISEDPRLLNYAYGNLHIASDSPCVDAGSDSDTAGDRDIDFQRRGLANPVDIGADECYEPGWAFVPPVVRVSPTGSDASDGRSWDQAKKTIQAGIDALAATGGEVWVSAGTYTPAPDADPQTGITLPAYVYLYGGFSGQETSRDQRDWVKYPTYLTNTATSNAVLTASGGHRASAVDGFVFSVTGHSVPPSLGMIWGRGASPIIQNNVFDGAAGPWGQAFVSVSGGFPLISHNTFAHVSPHATAAVVCSRAAPTIANNVFRDNATIIGVIKCIVSAPALITNNLFMGNSGGQGIITAEFSARVVGNTFVGNTAETSAYAQGSAGSYFANNIVAGNTFKYAAGYFRGPVSWLRNNCFYQSGDTRGLAGSNGNLDADPEFADANNGDYHLSATSPTVDAGDDGAADPLGVDLDGNPRRQGRHVDMGAYESSATAPSHHWNDVLDALRIAGGLQAVTPEEAAFLNADGVPGVGLADAAALLKILTAD